LYNSTHRFYSLLRGFGTTQDSSAFTNWKIHMKSFLNSIPILACWRLPYRHVEDGAYSSMLGRFLGIIGQELGVSLSATGYMLWSFNLKKKCSLRYNIPFHAGTMYGRLFFFSFFFSVDSYEVIGDFYEFLNCDQLSLKLNWFNCNYIDYPN
jgi:hypothetical protein